MHFDLAQYFMGALQNCKRSWIISRAPDLAGLHCHRFTIEYCILLKWSSSPSLFRSWHKYLVSGNKPSSVCFWNEPVLYQAHQQFLQRWKILDNFVRLSLGQLSWITNNNSKKRAWGSKFCTGEEQTNSWSNQRVPSHLLKPPPPPLTPRRNNNSAVQWTSRHLFQFHIYPTPISKQKGAKSYPQSNGIEIKDLELDKSRQENSENFWISVSIGINFIFCFMLLRL